MTNNTNASNTLSELESNRFIAKLAFIYEEFALGFFLSHNNKHNKQVMQVQQQLKKIEDWQ